MTTQAEMVKARAKKLHASLLRMERARLNKLGIRGGIKLKLEFTAAELAEWMMEQSTPPGSGLLWICPYTGDWIELSHNPKRPGDALTIDHAIPRAMGGLTILDNLVITSVRTNRVKADLRPSSFRMLYQFLRDNLCDREFRSVTRRLGQPPNYRLGRRQSNT